MYPVLEDQHAQHGNSRPVQLTAEQCCQPSSALHIAEKRASKLYFFASLCMTGLPIRSSVVTPC
jgi:hypothetical protein